MKIKIAVVQFKIINRDSKENLKNAEIYIKNASKQNTNIIIFPEDFILGPIIGDLELVDYKGKYLDIMKELAYKYKIDIVAGSIIEGDRKGVYNTTYYIDSTGKVKGKYRKINLWIPERWYLTPGNEICVFNTKYGKIGLIICWDLAFPEIFKAMINRGVNIIFCPSYWCVGDAGNGMNIEINSEKILVNSMATARAFENEIIFVYANFAGDFEYKGKIDPSIGSSQITIPFLGPLKRIENNREVMFVQEVDTDILRIAESNYRIRQDHKKKIM